MGIGYNPQLVTNGLVLCLDAANRKSYPGSGTTWFDITGNNNTGTFTNGPTFGDNSILFDGVNDYVTVTNGNYINSNNFTVSCFMYFDDITTTFTGYSFLNKNVYNTSGISAAIGTGGAVQNRLCSFRFSTSNAIASVLGLVPSLQSLPFNAWHEIAFTFSYDGSNSYITLYIDGKFSASSNGFSGTFVTNTQAMTIGQPGAGNGVHHKGKISSYRIYNRALSASEIQQNFNATRGRYGI
jgi:hypothetical protein